MFSQGKYRAAVVEFDALPEPFLFPHEVMLNNAEQYLKLIERASEKRVDIIVFPEDGLTTLDVAKKTPQKLANYSIEVPDPAIYPNPRINESYNKVLRMLSFAAHEHHMYIVINLIEKFKDIGFTFYYNTDVVFDRNGVIVVRYRKINLVNDPKLHPGKELAKFRTDFGVTFGIFTCNDILYRRPAVDIVQDKNLTDIILPSAWYSETPFIQSLSIQAGYARATGVNLLAAGLNYPPMYGGSGIYLHDGRIAELYISPSKSSKLIIQDVPKSRVKLSAIKCNNNSHPTPRFRLGGHLNEGMLNTPHEDMSLHTLHPLNFHDLETKVKLCNYNGEYCCRFRVVLQERPAFHDPKYMLALFYGVRTFGDTTIGVRSCGLIACLNKDKSTCGMRNHTSRSETIFKQISIRGNFDHGYNDNFDMPITLTYEQLPLTEYTYCETLTDDKKAVLAEMRSTQPLTNLMSFGIFGRMYVYDGRNPGIITNGVHSTLSNNVLVVCTLIMILLVRKNV